MIVTFCSVSPGAGWSRRATVSEPVHTSCWIPAGRLISAWLPLPLTVVQLGEETNVTPSGSWSVIRALSAVLGPSLRAVSA